MKKIYCTVILANDPLEIPLANKVALIVKDEETEIEACSNFARDIAMENSLEEKKVLIQWYSNYNNELPVYNFGSPYSESFIKEYKEAMDWWFNLSEQEQLNIFKGNNKGYYLISEDSLISYLGQYSKQKLENHIIAENTFDLISFHNQISELSEENIIEILKIIYKRADELREPHKNDYFTFSGTLKFTPPY